MDAVFDTAEDLAVEVDRQIHSLYQIFPSNIVAWKIQQGDDTDGLDQLKQQWPEEDWSQAEAKFKDHLNLVPIEQQSLVIDAYAAPVKNQLDYQESSSDADSLVNEDAIVC